MCAGSSPLIRPLFLILTITVLHLNERREVTFESLSDVAPASLVEENAIFRRVPLVMSRAKDVTSPATAAALCCTPSHSDTTTNSSEVMLRRDEGESPEAEATKGYRQKVDLQLSLSMSNIRKDNV